MTIFYSVLNYWIKYFTIQRYILLFSFYLEIDKCKPKDYAFVMNNLIIMTSVQKVKNNALKTVSINSSVLSHFVFY